MERAPRHRHEATSRAPTGNAARDLVAARRRARPAAAPLPPLPSPSPPRLPKHAQAADQMPGLYEFEPRRSSRLALTVCLLAGIVASTLLVRAAVQTRDTPSIGLAAVAVLATALVWAIRAGTSVTRLAVRQGQLEVLHQGGRLVFDLAGDHTVPEVHGRPGGRGWRVVLPRGDQEPFVVDASIVDADDFMRVLRFFKPHLAEH